MRTRRSGLAHTRTIGGDVYRYTFIPGHNDTLQVENPHGILTPLYRCPDAVKAQINMSQGHAGMKVCALPWWKRVRFHVAAWWDGVRSNLGCPVKF